MSQLRETERSVAEGSGQANDSTLSHPMWHILREEPGRYAWGMGHLGLPVAWHGQRERELTPESCSLKHAMINMYLFIYTFTYIHRYIHK